MFVALVVHALSPWWYMFVALVVHQVLSLLYWSLSQGDNMSDHDPHDHDPRLFRWPHRWHMWQAIRGNNRDIDELPDCDDGMPRINLAYKRIRDHLRAWRDRHEADDDPWYDENKEPFHVSDVAILFAEYQRLYRLEDEGCARVLTGNATPGPKIPKLEGYSTMLPPWRRRKGNPRYGHVMHGIENAFIAAGGKDLTSSELISWTHALPIYQRRGSRANYSRALALAAARVGLIRVGRACGLPGRPWTWRKPNRPE
jgi:hypothetical protein